MGMGGGVLGSTQLPKISPMRASIPISLNLHFSQFPFIALNLKDKSSYPFSQGVLDFEQYLWVDFL